MNNIKTRESEKKIKNVIEFIEMSGVDVNKLVGELIQVYNIENFSEGSESVRLEYDSYYDSFVN